MPKVNRTVAICVAVAVLPAIGMAIGWGIHTNIWRGLGAGLALLFAGFVVGLALSLPGLTFEGLLLGVGVPVAAMMTWTHLNQPAYVWAAEMLLGAIALAITFPWWREWRGTLRLGSFWLVIPCWVFGLVSAGVLLRTTVFAQRVVYLLYAVAVLLVIYRAARHRGKDISVGFAAGILFGQAALLVAGCTYFFLLNGAPHYTSQSAWGHAQEDRFWGGPLLVYHPNFIGMTVVIAAARIGADPKFRRWQRLAVILVAGMVLIAVKSRTSLLIAIGGSAVYLIGYAWQAGLPRWRFWGWLATRDWRRVVARGLVPLAVCAVVFAASGGTDLIFKNRYAVDNPTGGMLSGRPDEWAMVFRDFKVTTIVEKTFGTADNSRGYMLRYTKKTDPNYKVQPKLTADNGPIGSLRRGGVLGLGAFIVGFVLVLWRTTRSGLPLWIPVATITVLLTSITEDEIAGTNPAWIMAAVAEAYVLFLWRRDVDPPTPSPAAAPEQPEPVHS